MWVVVVVVVDDDDFDDDDDDDDDDDPCLLTCMYGCHVSSQSRYQGTDSHDNIMSNQ